VFVTGTDTGAGKTVLSAALLAALLAAGEIALPYKPVLTGLDDPPDGGWPADDELLAGLAGVGREEVAPLRFGPAVSPHLAAELGGEAIDRADLLAGARALARRLPQSGTLIVEGVGGLLVPFGERYAVRDLAGDLGLPLLIAARPGLGTINHTLLTLEAARAAGLAVLAVVLTPWPAEPGALERSNRATIERLGGVEVSALRHVEEPTAGELAGAGDGLPWRRWLGFG
jgi:dethiobiotin synthetase